MTMNLRLRWSNQDLFLKPAGRLRQTECLRMITAGEKVKKRERRKTPTAPK
jgi:hypothetical protein